MYHIQKGDTYYLIAALYHTTVVDIMAANPMKIQGVNDITPGYYIYVPVDLCF